MAQEHEPADSLDFLHSQWFWITAGLLAAAVIGLTVAYYLRHPERDLFSDFANRGIGTNAASTGHVPHAEARPGVDIVEGVPLEAEG